MYEDFRLLLKIEKEEKQQILILGQFNAKMEAAIESNKTEVTKRRRQLLKLVNKENMIILSTVKEKWKGIWTRVQGREQFINDYVLADITSANTVKETKKDVEKQFGLRSRKLNKNIATNENKQITVSY